MGDKNFEVKPNSRLLTNNICPKKILYGRKNYIKRHVVNHIVIYYTTSHVVVVEFSTMFEFHECPQEKKNIRHFY